MNAFLVTAALQGPADDQSLMRWLATSYWLLPSDTHRRMFLDAATMLHGEQWTHLQPAWTAQASCDLGPEQLDSETRATDAVRAELVLSSLVEVDEGGRCADLAWSRGAAVRLCSVTLLSVW